MVILITILMQNDDNETNNKENIARAQTLGLREK